MFSVETWEEERDGYEFKYFDVYVAKWQGEDWELARQTWPGHNSRLCFRRRERPLLFDTGMFKNRSPETTEEQMERMFNECLKGDEWERELWLNHHFQLRSAREEAFYSLSVSPNGSGNFMDEDLWSVPFKWDAQDVSRIEAEELMAHLEGQDDFRFARDFIQMSEDERWQQAWTWKHGDHHELKQVMTWAFGGDEDSWQKGADLRLRLILHKKGCPLKLFGPPDSLHGQDTTLLLSDALYEALSTAINHFQSTLNWPHVEQHEALLQLLQTGFWKIDIHLQNRTAHERIEAALKWREWLAERGLSA